MTQLQDDLKKPTKEELINQLIENIEEFKFHTAVICDLLKRLINEYGNNK